jgi:signal transduction histidine kinase
MSTDHLQFLRNIDLFESFSEEELKSFTYQIKEVRHRTGETLFTEGEPGCDMFVLLEGTLKIYKENRFIANLYPVDYIGEMSIIENKPRSATVQVTAPSLLLKISSADFQTFLAAQPQSLVSMMRRLSQRIRKDTELIAAEFEKTNILIHDMRNILSTFLFLNAMEKRAADEEQRRWCGFMQKARRNLTAMTDEALARSKRLHYTAAVEPMCLASLLAEMMEVEFSVHPELSDRTIELRAGKNPPPFPCSRLGIRRVIFNLVLNAAQASEPGGSLEIEIDLEGNQAVLRVLDDGEGVPVHLREKIFEPRFTTRLEGHGLGLASCRQIIAEHGGTLWCEPNRPTGTVFTFTLPLQSIPETTGLFRNKTVSKLAESRP